MRSPRSFSSPRVRQRERSRRAGVAAALLAVCALAMMAAPAPAAPAPARPIDLDPAVAAKLLKKEEPPDYPALAKVNYIQGMVRLRVFVDPDGRISEAHVVQGHPFLAASALKAVRGWVYKPYRVGKQAVEYWTLIDFHFNLRAKGVNEFPPAAEKDLQQRVTPPKVLEQPADPPNDAHVRIRVLVDPEGRALDTEIISGEAADVAQAKEEVLRWKFRPARWGALPVPWYLVVDVPIHHAAALDPPGL